MIQRFPVTNRQFIAFLDGLLGVGRRAEAVSFTPQGGGMVVGAEGRIVLVDTAIEELAPVVGISQEAAAAYGSWYGARTGQPWRLPGEYEWEKACRGVDGRMYPWGDRYDPSWCNNVRSTASRAGAVAVDTFEVDASPFGVRGMAGNVRDWTSGREFGSTGASVSVGKAVEVVVRGGDFRTDATAGLGEARPRLPARQGFAFVGFRLVRTWPII